MSEQGKPTASGSLDGNGCVAKPREWWIIDSLMSGRTWITESPLNPSHQEKEHEIHVIEKSAYDAAQAELAQLREKFERNSIAAGMYSLEVDELKKKLAAMRTALERVVNSGDSDAIWVNNWSSVYAQCREALEL